MRNPNALFGWWEKKKKKWAQKQVDKRKESKFQIQTLVFTVTKIPNFPFNYFYYFFSYFLSKEKE